MVSTKTLLLKHYYRRQGFLSRARKKPININIFGGPVSGTNRNGPWDKWDPSRDKMGPVPGTNRPFLCLIPQSNRHFVPFVPGTGGGSSLGTIVPQGPSEKCLCVFPFIGFFFCSPLSRYFCREACPLFGRKSYIRYQFRITMRLPFVS